MLFKKRYDRKLTLDFWENLSTMNDFIGYVGLKEFCCKIWPKSNNTVQEILTFKIFFSCRPFTQHVSHVFSFSNFRLKYLASQSEIRKSLIPFCLLIPCE